MKKFTQIHTDTINNTSPSLAMNTAPGSSQSGGGGGIDMAAGFGGGSGGFGGGGGGFGGGGAGTGSGSGVGGGVGGGQPVGGGIKKGDLYGDQYVLLRDVDATDGGGNGEPVLDDNGQPILVGTNGLPIYYVMNTDGDYEIPPDQVAFTQTVELERANVARAPDKVMEKSLDAAMAKIEGAAELTTDPAGRIVCDGVTIDSPLENLALYQYLMTAGGQSSWPAVTQHWPDALQDLIGSNVATPDWDPASLLGAAFSKSAPISLDAVLYQNTVLGVNSATLGEGQLMVDYFDFSRQNQESYSYDRDALFEGVWLQWFEDTDGDPTSLEQVQMSLLEAVFNNTEWTDAYLSLNADGTGFDTTDATTSGVNDFAQAAEDARAVINFMHETGAVQIAMPTPTDLPDADSAMALGTTELAMVTDSEDEHDGHDGGHGGGHDDGHGGGSSVIYGTQFDDVIEAGGGPQTILTGNGQDEVWAGGGPDVVDTGNGKDLLMGQGGPDELMGGNGQDVLVGGPGPDQLTGGHGPDVFVYNATSDAPARGESVGGDEHSGHMETITDFDPATDHIDFSALALELQMAEGPQAHAIWAEPHRDGAMLYLDTNGQVEGGHPAEMSILLMGVSAGSLDIEHFVV